MRSHKLLKYFVLVFICAAALTNGRARPLRVGIFSDRRAAAVEAIQSALEENGFETAIITRSRNKAEFTGIYDCDVLFFGGGWTSYNWISAEDRIHLVEFVEQRGGGAIFSMFRCGTAARSMIRPLFPEVADAYNKVNSRGMILVDPAHPVTEGLPEQFLDPYWDHAVLRLGPQGRALAVNTGGEISMACGEAGRGRVVFIGPWIGLDIGSDRDGPLPETDKRLLLNSVRWAGGSEYRDRSDDREPGEAAQLKVLRREIITDWTHDERGKSWWPGLLPRARDLREQELDDLHFTVNRYAAIAEQTGAAGKVLDLQNRIAVLKDELSANYAQAVRLKTLEILRMPLAELRAEPVRDLAYGRRGCSGCREEDRKTIVEEWRCRLLFPHQVDPVAAAVRELESRLEPELEKYEAAQFAAARAEDARNLDVLTAQLESDDAETRAAAALELARIGAPETAAPLIRALGDPEYRVRRSAIYALSWMQSRDAVPALIELVDTDDDAWTRRRAAQALGQIGDARALKSLVRAAEKDDDIHVRYNAVLSLGWLGDNRAMPELLGIAEKSLKYSADEDAGDSAGRACEHRRMLACAVRALGNIGDEKALPFLERPGIPSFPSSFRAPDVDLASEAVASVKAGGRGGAGVQQPDIMRDKDHFYWMSGRFNALYGRYTGFRAPPESSDVMLSYAASGGGTGTVEFNTVDKWTERRPEIDIDKHFERASRFGLKINTQMPTLPQYVNKALFERDIMQLAHHPSFGGLWLEECVSLDGIAKASGDESFRRFLQSRYTAEQLAGLGIKDLETVLMPQPDSGRIYERDGARADKVLFAEYLEYAAGIGIDAWRETQEWTAGLRKGAKLSFSLSARYEKGGSTFINAYSRINLVLDAGGPQSYGEHSARNNFNLDLHVDGEPRPAQGEFYAHQADTPGRVERGFASSFVYGQQFFNWWWGHIFKHAPHHNAGSSVYDHGRWEAAVRQFSKGKALSEYLAPRATRGAGLVTQLYSGRTTTLTYGDGMIDSFGGRGRISAGSPGGYPLRYTQNQIAFRESILRSHLPLEMTWIETQTPAKLAGYKVAILADAVSLDKSEVDMLREWVRDGGSLIATASSTLHDQWDRKRENYALADVFGVDYIRTEGEPSLIYVERDLKPDTGITEITVTASEYLDLMGNAGGAEYEKNIGYDIIKPTTARIVGAWDDGAPAIVENSYGDGHAIFIAASYPALSHWTRDWTVDALYNTYWPGMRELLAACVRRGLELAGAELPVTVENCPLTVDVVLKRQEQNSRWMLHLLNMDEKNGLIQDVKVTVKPPHAVKSVYYAYPYRSDLQFEQSGSNLEFVVRPFDVHEMIVVEW